MGDMKSRLSLWKHHPLPKPRFAVWGVFFTVALGAAPAFAQSGVSYQPSQRVRTALETCMKDEVSEGAYCIKKCAANFRLDAQKRPPVCIATNAAAKVPAATVPEWNPPPPPKDKKPGA
jgi:hypothetical protein